MKLFEGKSSEKKQNLLRLLDFGTVMLFVDTRKMGVVVPPQHGGNPQLPINLDYAFHLPDFKITDDSVEASLSFNRQRFFCVFPFKSIYALSSKAASEALVYTEDMPKDTSLFEAPTKSAPEASISGESKPKLTLLANQTAAAAPEAETILETEKPSAQAPPKRNHLKLVD